MGFVQIKINPSAGETISVTAIGIASASVLIALATEKQCVAIKQAIDGDDETNYLATTAQDVASRDNPTVRFVIPHDDKWNILYQPHQTASGDVRYE